MNKKSIDETVADGNQGFENNFRNDVQKRLQTYLFWVENVVEAVVGGATVVELVETFGDECNGLVGNVSGEMDSEGGATWPDVVDIVDEFKQRRLAEVDWSIGGLVLRRFFKGIE